MICSDFAKDKETKKEIRRLRRIFKEIDPKRKESAIGLIEEAGFMRATLKELKVQINDNGPLDEYTKGTIFIYVSIGPMRMTKTRKVRLRI